MSNNLGLSSTRPGLVPSRPGATIGQAGPCSTSFKPTSAKFDQLRGQFGRRSARFGQGSTELDRTRPNWAVCFATKSVGRLLRGQSDRPTAQPDRMRLPPESADTLFPRPSEQRSAECGGCRERYWASSVFCVASQFLSETRPGESGPARIFLSARIGKAEVLPGPRPGNSLPEWGSKRARREPTIHAGHGWKPCQPFQATGARTPRWPSDAKEGSVEDTAHSKSGGAPQQPAEFDSKHDVRDRRCRGTPPVGDAGHRAA